MSKTAVNELFKLWMVTCDEAKMTQFVERKARKSTKTLQISAINIILQPFFFYADDMSFNCQLVYLPPKPDYYNYHRFKTSSS